MVFRKPIRNLNEKDESKINKPVYLGLSILEIILLPATFYH